MAKLLNIYALASDGTKVNATPSTINAVPADQVATADTLGLVKIGDNTEQGKENEKDVNYLELNADGVAFTPDYDIKEAIYEPKFLYKYNMKLESSNTVAQTFCFFTDKQMDTSTLVFAEEDKKYTKYINSIYEGDSSKDNLYASKEMIYTYDETLKGYAISMKLVTTSGSTTTIELTKSKADGSLTVTASEEIFYYDKYLDIYPEEDPTDKHTIYVMKGVDVRLENLDKEDSGKVAFIYTSWGNRDAYVARDFCLNNGNPYGFVSSYSNKFAFYYKSNTVGVIADEIKSSIVQNPVALTDDKKLFISAESLQIPQATKTTLGGLKVAYLAGTNDDVIKAYGGSNTDTYAWLESQSGGMGYVHVFPATSSTIGSVKIAAAIPTNYTAITENVSYKNPLLLDNNNMGYVAMLQANTNIPGVVKVVPSYTTYTTRTDYTIASIIMNSDTGVPYVRVLPATTSLFGAVRITAKYNDYGDNIDSQEVARLRINSDGFAFTANLPATNTKLGHIKVYSSVSNYVYISALDYKSPVVLDENNYGYVHVFPASTSALGSVKLGSNSTGAYGNSGGSTTFTKFINLDTNGCAYVPFEKGTYTLPGIVQPHSSWMTVDSGIIYPKPVSSNGQHGGIVNIEPAEGMPGQKYLVLCKASAESSGKYNNLVINPTLQKYLKYTNGSYYASDAFFSTSASDFKFSAFYNSSGTMYVPTVSKGTTSVVIDGVTYYQIVCSGISEVYSVGATATMLAIYQLGSCAYINNEVVCQLALVYPQTSVTPSWKTKTVSGYTGFSYNDYYSYIKKYYIDGSQFTNGMVILAWINSGAAGAASKLSSVGGLLGYDGTLMRVTGYGNVLRTKTPNRVIRVTSDIYANMFGAATNDDDKVLALDPASIDTSSLGNQEQWTFTLSDGSTVTKNVLLA